MARHTKKPVKIYTQLPIISNDEKDWKTQQDEELRLKFTVKPLNKNQEKLKNGILTSVITISTGPAGTAKTFMSCATACQLLVEGKIDKIILCRPAVECGETLGYRPGDDAAKVTPFLYPLLDCLDLFLGEKVVQRLIKEKKIVLAVVGLLRGSSFRNSIIIIDEAQNLTYAQLFMLLTRTGENCRLSINGDCNQSDLKYNKGDFLSIIHKLQSLKDEISFVNFTDEDIVRSSIVRKIVKLLG